MATDEERMQVRRNTGEVGSDTYSDVVLDAYILDAAGDLDLASVRIWREKASSYAELVDISEAGSSRKNSDLFKNANAQADYFTKQAEGDVTLEPGTYSTTRSIIRR